ncbi:30S ribosomal protein S4 [Caldithrix abyssi]|uniref:Small ribosomal subunit protein uS4 n=1 Tax=Caldithrix abyssi DSM 13497 TaxID=880073 RepID=H1XVZ0_CALAY|nr:30S ribosomal protein S4 [Caldithrix abyssi]APF17678.1 rpsD small subunit ribosomal protein S4 [Caldithrix abyssi DSM 13497]EHO41762.1 ribosomal protein S4 [Caldithrix abyssi DSM 13497]
MARYKGPRGKIVRKFGENIFGNPKFDRLLAKKPYPPGQHGMKRKKVSDYALQLREKQKVKYMYGLLEKQFRRFFHKAERMKGVTGENLLQLLESRLDNTVYRLGFATTRAQARQMVLHRHIMVNGQVVNIPSFILKPGDVIQVREKSRRLAMFHEALKRVDADRMLPWLELDKANMTGKFIDRPKREDIPVNVQESMIVELYSK